MGVVECFDYFGVHDDGLIDDQIRDEFSDGTLFVKDGVVFLLLEEDALFRKLNAQGVLIEFFIQTISEFTMNFLRRTDDALGKFGMNPPIHNL